MTSEVKARLRSRKTVLSITRIAKPRFVRLGKVRRA
jgi:hypothetical protein